MNRYKLITGVSVLLIITAANLSADESETVKLDFGSAVTQMLSTNELLQSVRMEKEKSEYEKKAAFGLFFPKINIGFTYMHLDEPLEMDFNPLKDAMIGLDKTAMAASGNASKIPAYEAMIKGNSAFASSNFIETIQEKDFWTVNATIRQPIFTGGKIIAANRAAAANLEAVNEKVRYTQYALMTELSQRYYAVRLTSKVVDVRKEVLNGMKEHLAEAKKMEENGMIPNAERLHAEVAYSEAEREYKKSQRDADTARAAIKNTLSLHKIIEPVSELFVSDNIQEMDYYIKKAAELNPVLAQLKANHKLAEQGYMKELAKYSPDVFVFGSKDLLNKNLSENTPEWFVGAGATMTLFDGFSRYNNVKAASATEQRVDAAIKKAHRDIETLVEKNYNELMKDLEQIQTLQKSMEFAEEYFRVRDTAFKAGFATSIDVVDARLNLSKIKIERLQALYEFDVSLAKLLEVSGLSEQYESYRKDSRQESEFLLN